MIIPIPVLGSLHTVLWKKLKARGLKRVAALLVRLLLLRQGLLVLVLVLVVLLLVLISQLLVPDATFDGGGSGACAIGRV